MNKQVEQIKAEIERLIRYLGEQRDINLEELLSFINSLPEEPVSGLDNGKMSIDRWKEACKAASNQANYREKNGLTETRDDYFVDGVQWADEHPIKEPVSEDLEKAAVEAFKNIVDEDRNSFLEIFKAGAKWKEQQMQDVIRIAKDRAMFAGMEKIKEELMKNVVLETTIIKEDDGCAEDFNYKEWLKYEDDEIVDIPEWCKAGDVVKLIVIKSE